MMAGARISHDPLHVEAGEQGGIEAAVAKKDKAAIKVGVQIPHYCYHPSLPSPAADYFDTAVGAKGTIAGL